jgi:hypothetical protein
LLAEHCSTPPIRPSTGGAVLVSIEQKTIPGGLSPEEWGMLMQVLATIKGAIPAGSNAPPAEVFAVIETALRSHFAREIPASGRRSLEYLGVI